MLPQVDVWSGPRKYETAIKAMQSTHYDLAIIDDGFSHLRLKKNLNLVLFDVSQSQDHYQLIPLGHLREPFSSLVNADMVILTKLENQPPDKIDLFRKEILKHNSSLFESQYQMRLPSDLKKQIFLVTTIANPLPILQFLKQMQYSVVKHIKYSDHYALNEHDQKRILKDLQFTESDVDILVTEKDKIKITNKDLLSRTKVIQLKVDISQQAKAILYEKISQIF